VNELLLYGAQYSVTNANKKTPIELTTDDEVKYVIQKAMRGEIAVGSYKLPPKLNEYPEKISAAGRLGSSPVTIQGKPKSGSNADVLAKSSESPRVSKRDEKLDTLLRAIETYDRRASLQQTETDDRSAPILQPATETNLDFSVSSSSFGAL